MTLWQMDAEKRDVANTAEIACVGRSPIDQNRTVVQDAVKQRAIKSAQT